MMTFFTYFNILNLLEAFRHSIKVKSRNTQFKVYILAILEKGFNIKAQQGNIQELVLFREKFEYSFQRLDIDTDPAIRKQGHKLHKSLNQLILTNARIETND